jgi:myo-inositol-1(or 4)-monophosphatase
MHGSAAIDLAWLAEGRVDAVIIASNRAWDVAAGVAIAREAGAEIVDLDGSPHTISSSATIAASKQIIHQTLALVAKANGMPDD